MTTPGIPEAFAPIPIPEAFAPQPSTTTVNGLRIPLPTPGPSHVDPAIVGKAIGTAAKAVAGVVVQTAVDVANAFQSTPVVGPEGMLPVPKAEEFQAARQARLAAMSEEQREALHDSQVRGWAFLGTVAADVATGGVRLFAQPIANSVARGSALGALYGILRPKEEGEGIGKAIVKDAALFGGMNLAGSLAPVLASKMGIVSAAPAIKALEVDVSAIVGGRSNQLRRAIELDIGLSTRGEVATELAPRVVDDAADIGGNILALARNERGAVDLNVLRGDVVPKDVLERLAVIEHPRDLFAYGAWMAPPHTWGKINPIAGAITHNAVERRLVQDGIHSEVRSIVKRLRAELTPEERIELGGLLDSHITGEDLPAGTPQKLATWFGEMRATLNEHRANLASLIKDAPPDWGIDAYFMHVFVGDWVVRNAATKEVLEFGGRAGFTRTFAEAKQLAVEALKSNPNLQLSIGPKTFTWERDGALALGRKQYFSLVGRIAKELELDPTDVQQMVREGSIARPNIRHKFFGHTMQRERDLGGFIPDVADAFEVYGMGYARKMAFHDFEEKALLAMEQIDKTAQPVLYDSLKEYIGRVLGRPSTLEKAWNGMASWALGKLPESAQVISPTGVSLRSVAGGIRSIESMWRLGYSPMSAFVNYTQTWVNTASKIGYGPVGAAHKTLFDARTLGKNAHEVDELLRAMGVEFHVPLSSADIYKPLVDLAWWHPLYLFNKVETVNRGIAALAKYGEARSAGLTREAAIEAGKQFSRDMNFVYSVEDLPRLLSGPVGQVVGQFKPFVVNEMHFIAGLRGSEIPRFAINLAAAGGVGAVLSLPPALLVDWVLPGSPIKDFGEKAIQKAPRLARGLPGLAGLDVTRNIEIGDPRTMVDLSPGPGVKDMQAILRLLPDQWKRLIGEREGRLTPRERAGLARQLMQVQARRLYDAYRVSLTGKVVQPTTGIEIFSPENMPEVPSAVVPVLGRVPTSPEGAATVGWRMVSRREPAITILGGRTVQRAEAERVVQRVKEERTARVDIRAQYIQEMLGAWERGDTEKVSALRRQAREKYGIAITATDLITARRSRGESTLDKALRGIPKASRPGVLEEITGQ